MNKIGCGGFKNAQSKKILKLHHWFKIYCNFGEWVDLFFCVSCNEKDPGSIGPGLVLGGDGCQGADRWHKHTNRRISEVIGFCFIDLWEILHDLKSPDHIIKHFVGDIWLV